MEDQAEHLRACLTHLSKGRSKQIVIVIDNADQRDDEVQQQAFLMAQEFAERWPATVFVSLRPETFHRSLQRGALSAYHPRAFTISPPRIDEVIKRRLRLPIALSAVASLGESAGSVGEEGFVETVLVYERLQGLGFTPEQIDAALIRGHRKRLLETSARRIPQAGQEMPQAIRVTTVGAYHARKLCRTFVYADAVTVDTPILDDEARSAIHNVRDIRDRLRRAETYR